MPYKYLPDIAIADAAFEAWGAGLDEAFISSADALTGVMMDDISLVEHKEPFGITLYNDDLEMLLYDFLCELVFIKDTRRLLSRVKKVEITESGGGYSLTAQAYGDAIDPARHKLLADVKAITLSRFSLERSDDGWKATVVVDI